MKLRLGGILCLLLLIIPPAIVWAEGAHSDGSKAAPSNKELYLSAEDLAFIRPGLIFKIRSLTIPENRKPVVVFEITDAAGQPLDREGILTPGVVTSSWVLAYLPSNGDQYFNYITRAVTSPITRNSTTQPTSDSGGSYQRQQEGVYAYTFGNALPANYDRTVTHTLGIYSTRDLRSWELSRYVVNPILNFVPDGSPVTRTREVVLTENCNQCHNPLGLHGGSRQDTRLCILCHTPQNLDPDTGNTVDFKVLVHKIHRGAQLPSVRAGKPYQIIGNQQRVNDFSDIAFPRDIRNCATCHQKAKDGNNWYLKPSRETCGSCHDDIDWNSGKNHAAGAQVSDRLCANCHYPEGDLEYDASIMGAHTVPYKSRQLVRPKFEILDISNTRPGQKPVVQFKITDKDGKPIAPAQMNRIALRLAGPTTDYGWYLLETAAGAVYQSGVATYTFTGGIPGEAQGTYTLGIEGYVNVTLNPKTTKELVYRDAGDNVVKSFAVTGVVTPRRTVVELSRCNRCHDKLQLHGNSRNDPQYCVGCHNATLTDAARRPASDKPDQGIHFKVLIHKIHRGEELRRDYTVYGFGSSKFNANEIRFPGDLRDCATCHVNNSYLLPLQEQLLPSHTPREFWTPTDPIAASCLACHDSRAAAAHAYVGTASFGESCDVCHREGAEFAVSKMHAR